jgi:hypothetical protein
MKSFSRAATVISILILAQLNACGGDDNDSDTGGVGGQTNGGSKATGGRSTATGGKSTGGSKATGGSSALGTGGASAVAGSSALAGSSATGGSKATGGSSTTGGTSGSTGGASSTGGSSGAVTGGSSATGGTKTAGGSSATGGTANAGGTTTTAGTSSIAGASTTGGSGAAGGATQTGGTSTAGGSSAVGGTTTAGGSSAEGGATDVGGGTTSTGGTTTAGGTSSAGGTTSVSEDLAILNAKDPKCGSCALAHCGNYLKDTYGTALDTANGFGSCFNTTVSALNQVQKIATYQPFDPYPITNGVAKNGTQVCLDVLACTIKSGCASGGVTSVCFCGDAVGADCIDSGNFAPPEYFTSTLGLASVPGGYALDSSDSMANGGSAISGTINGKCFIENIDGRNSVSPSAVAAGFGSQTFALGPANWLITCLQNESCDACFQ